jgi:hypothetical protein
LTVTETPSRLVGAAKPSKSDAFQVRVLVERFTPLICSQEPAQNDADPPKSEGWLIDNTWAPLLKAANVIESSAEAVRGANGEPSFAITLGLKVPEIVAMPLMTPLDRSIVRPGGNPDALHT